MIDTLVFLFVSVLFGYWTFEPVAKKDFITILAKVFFGIVSLYFFICLYGSLFS